MAKFNISKLVKEGKNTKKTIVIEAMDGDTIELSPLSRREWGEVEDIEAKSMGEIENIQKEDNRPGFRQKSKKQMKAEIKMKMKVQNTIVDTREARARAIYLSASKFDEEMKEDDVLELPTDVFNEIYEKVREISGIPKDEDEAEEMEKDFQNVSKDSGI